MVLDLLGGIGLFLLGMVLLTEGLKAAAGDALRTILARLTRGRLSAVASGASVTALVQSSSATSLATIGFVSAGLLTFPQAIGVIFGAALGTTTTGWMVSLIGFKVSVSVIAFPIVALGAGLMLLTRGRSASLGMALAGFGLIFVGIGVLQDGMAELAADIDPADVPGDTIAGALILVFIGLAMTVVMQSSSAAVATTLTALHSGAIGIESAAALVIGQNIGTSVTAGIAGIGASSPARRTAAAHIFFNVNTGIIALCLLPGFVWIANNSDFMASTTEIAAFHTAFNVIGVAVMLPFIPRIAALIERLIPEKGPTLTRHLDDSVADVPAVGIAAADRTAREIARGVFHTVHSAVAEVPNPSPIGAEELQEATTRTRRFLSHVATPPEDAGHYRHHLSLLHVLDHLGRLSTLAASPPRFSTIDGTSPLLGFAVGTAAGISEALAWLTGLEEDSPAQRQQELSSDLSAFRTAYRHELLRRAAAGEVRHSAAARELDAALWLDQVAHHTWRVINHLSDPRVPREGESETFAESAPIAVEV